MKRAYDHDSAETKNPRLGHGASGGVGTAASSQSMAHPGMQRLLGMPDGPATSGDMVPSFGMQQGMPGMAPGSGQFPNMGAGIYGSEGMLNPALAGVMGSLSNMGQLSMPYSGAGGRGQAGYDDRSGGQPSAPSWSGQASREGWMFVPSNMKGKGASQQSPQQPKGRPDNAGGDDAGSKRSRGNYKCSKCGLPKKGHICAYQPKLRRRDDVDQVDSMNAAVQVEMDPAMTVRELELTLQGTPESYNITQDAGMGSSVHASPVLEPIGQGMLPLPGGVLPPLPGSFANPLPDVFHDQGMALPATAAVTGIFFQQQHRPPPALTAPTGPASTTSEGVPSTPLSDALAGGNPAPLPTAMERSQDAADAQPVVAAGMHPFAVGASELVPPSLEAREEPNGHTNGNANSLSTAPR
uniref:Uncharacterized protein n=1 Tax=Rhizochromulina marina TaxID=1034831 RepID=A0A7S2RJQ8_9STRA|mmetsp:Transcript_17336/g.50594  ORF Transcript_17336/g.50594 Transcript_17336/m.50594 type:complete len:410 (+) Transcript_17336:82-1311(+)